MMLDSGCTPFQNAIKEKHFQMIDFLIKNGADLKMKTKHLKNSAIELALKEGGINIVKKFIY